jgi:hypothetical protein
MKWYTFVKLSSLIGWILMFGSIIIKVTWIGGLGAFLVITCLFVGVYEIAVSKKLNRDRKFLWLIGITIGNILMGPLYFLIYRDKILNNPGQGEKMSRQ